MSVEQSNSASAEQSNSVSAEQSNSASAEQRKSLSAEQSNSTSATHVSQNTSRLLLLLLPLLPSPEAPVGACIGCHNKTQRPVTYLIFLPLPVGTPELTVSRHVTLKTCFVLGTLVTRQNSLAMGSFRSLLLTEDHPSVLSCPLGLKRCHLLLSTDSSPGGKTVQCGRSPR